MYIVPQSNGFYRANKAYRVSDHIDTGNAVRIYFLE